MRRRLLPLPALFVAASCGLTPAYAQSTPSALVYQPAGTAGGTVYTDWATLMAARQPGPCWIEFRGADVHIPAGTWNVDGCTFLSHVDSTTGTDEVHFDDGCKLTFGALEFDHFFGEVDSTTPVVDLSAGQLYVSGLYSTIYSDTGKAPFLRVSGSAVATVVGVHGLGIGDGTTPVIEIVSPGALSLDVADSYVFDNALTGNGEVDLMFDSAAFLGSWAATNVHRTPSALASQVVYAPGDVTRWRSPAPKTVAEAIDRIAARVDGGL